MVQDKHRLQVESRTGLRAWLHANHHQPDGVWLVTFKRHTGDKYISYDEIVEDLICFGWIDSLPRKLDDERTMLWIAPRKLGSNWSKVNRERVAKLTKCGLMHHSGKAKIDEAKNDGSWTALDAVEALKIPDDLAAEFSQYNSAQVYFEAFPKSTKRGILEWIFNAKRPATRAKRIKETAMLAQNNIRANQWPKTDKRD